MMSEMEQRILAEGLVGQDVMPVLYVLEDGLLKSRELPVDRFSEDDDGFYLTDSNLRVSTKAIVENHYSEEEDLVVLQLDECYTERRVYN